MSAPFGLREVREACSRVSSWLHRTPVLTSHSLDHLSGRKLFFKAENLQKTGSFKARGACNAVLLEKEWNPGSPGVVTHSTGNHGQAVAYAARGDAGERPVWPTVDLAEQNAAHLASCAPQVDHSLPPISCRDLFETLQVHKSVLPCHSAYILGMERISSRLWHPSWGEVEQEAMAAQEASLRDTLKEHRLAANPVN